MVVKNIFSFHSKQFPLVDLNSLTTKQKSFTATYLHGRDDANTIAGIQTDLFQLNHDISSVQESNEEFKAMPMQLMASPILEEMIS
ncbi:hypothetical protein QE152_g32489 [Popillia japonica]|uniref:Uncharacterized protein n=1 Tax=Popillia japonica TaxID=7064 RepID=A0AAW1IYZ1_POPJA